MKKNIILGIHPWHDASVAFVADGELLFAIAEERLSRIKHHYGFPILGILKGMEVLGISSRNIAAIAISTKKPILPHPKQFRITVNGDCEVVRNDYYQSSFFNFRRKPVPLGKIKIPREWIGQFEDRHWSAHYPQLLQAGLMDPSIPIYNIEHHKSHSSAAFRSKKWNSDVCVISFDGKGDNLSHTTSLGHKNGKVELLRSSTSQNSLGAFYQAITESLGFIPVDGEYKTMGLAALGKKGSFNPFENVIKVEDGQLFSIYDWQYRPYNIFNPEKMVNNPLSSVAQTDIFRKQLDNMSPEDFAFCAQEIFELTTLELVRQSMRITKARNLALSGGCALNVKANLRILEEFELDDLFVFPDAGDSGNSIGAALEASHNIQEVSNHTLSNMYLGTSYSNSEIESFLLENEIPFTQLKKEKNREIVKSLIDGKVIGIFQNKMEFGPRALGNRSVIADPRNPKIKDRINEILKGREWFVPFAPIVLDEDKHLYYNSKTSLKHMTIAIRATNYAKEFAPNIVHFDGSMRPQEVSIETNSELHALLNEFKHSTGIGVLMNTSFNRHGLPIVESPKDCLDHLKNGWIDVLVLGDYIIYGHNQR